MGLNLSNAQIAQELGLNPNDVQRMTDGLCDVPGYDLIEAFQSRDGRLVDHTQDDRPPTSSRTRWRWPGSGVSPLRVPSSTVIVAANTPAKQCVPSWPTAG
jgi:hypothetical protein